ncbi:hypothetical protein [Roseibium aggregatum]|uniref:Uncharacterized protein n=1 Tax=Roseibium aggregatum TaxID=187304 RepID=A0A926NXI7_9HYPH|nr:hypothetical protein [Roseibium aggregatum]MBD1545068.1 hypothetical protein [Roseibium aggregatum]
MSDETSLVGALNAEELAVTSAAPAAQDQPAQTTEASSAIAAVAKAPGLTDDEQRAAIMEHLKALALANQERPAGSLSTSVAELKRLQATHGDTALSEISGANTAQN